MAKTQEKIEAEKLRHAGHSIGEIAKLLRVSKGTVSMWCRDIVLTQRQIATIAKRSKHHATGALLRASEEKRNRRISDHAKIMKIAQKQIGALSKRDIHMIGLGLYWGEGYKKGSQEFGFTNSDPYMITFYIAWLTTIFNVQKSDLILRISINELHKSRIDKVTQFWSKITKIPETQFTKPSLIKTTLKKKYKNFDEHYGTLRVKVRRGTAMRQKVLASLEYLKQF